MVKWLLVVGFVLPALLLGGCGGGDSGNDATDADTTAPSSAFDEEVRGAMETIGAFVGGNEATKIAARANREARRCLNEGDAGCAEENLDTAERETEKSEFLLSYADFDSYSKKAHLEAMKTVESEGLVGAGCKEDAKGRWSC